MKLIINLQNPYRYKRIPTKDQFKKWAVPALKNYKNAEVTIRIVNEKESALLNKQFRNKEKSTNVLAFPVEAITKRDNDHLGDLVICFPVVRREATQQNKKIIAHLAHLTIHGLLHLLGYDHIKPAEAKRMEKLESAIMQQLGFANPYRP